MKVNQITIKCFKLLKNAAKGALLRTYPKLIIKNP